MAVYGTFNVLRKIATSYKSLSYCMMCLYASTVLYVYLDPSTQHGYTTGE